VQYFFRVRSSDPCDLLTRTLAVISLWSDKDEEFWRISNRTVWHSRYQGQACLAVISVTDIESCVAMIPHKIRDRDGSVLVEKPGLGPLSYRQPDRDQDHDRDEDAESGEDA
jgi:hypothetical protein